MFRQRALRISIPTAVWYALTILAMHYSSSIGFSSSPRQTILSVCK